MNDHVALMIDFLRRLELLPKREPGVIDEESLREAMDRMHNEGGRGPHEVMVSPGVHAAFLDTLREPNEK